MVHGETLRTTGCSAPADFRPYVGMVITYSKGKDQPGKVANPARGHQLNRENENFPVPVCACKFGPARGIRPSRLELAYGWISVVNAIGTQLRDLINSGLIRWRMAVSINKWTPPRKSGVIP